MIQKKLSALIPKKTHHISAIAALLILLFLSNHLRSADIHGNIGIQNLETPWHVLLTVEAMSETSPRIHWFLPIVTLGAPRDKGVPWGATNSDSKGYYYYTSATSPTFVLPYLWFKTLGQQPTIENLAKFNFLLQIVSVLMLYGLVYAMLRCAGILQNVAAYSAVIAAQISIFSREAFVAFGTIYWFHSLYQILLIAALGFILLAIARPAAFGSSKLIPFSITCLLGAWVEWTGYVFNIGAATILLLFRRSRKTVIIAATMVASTVLAGLLVLVHYRAIELPALMWRMRDRLKDRNPFAGGGILDNFLLLIQGYLLSFGPFLIILLVSAFALRKTFMESGAKKLLAVMFVVSTVPLAENIVLMENSAEFSYARLKFVVPAAILLSIALAFSKSSVRIALTAAIGVSSLLGYWTYKEDLKYYAKWEAIDANNRYLRDKIIAEPGFECSVLVTNVITRGYPTLLFHSMIYETWAFPKSSDELENLKMAIEKKNACKGIFLKGNVPNDRPPYTDLPVYVGAVVMTREGNITSITVDDPVDMSTNQSLYVRLFSYQGHFLFKRLLGYE